MARMFFPAVGGRTARVLLASLALLAVLAGCGPQVEGLYHHPAYGPLAAVRGGMLVAGVGAAPYPLHPAEANQLAEELRLALQDELPAMAVTGAGATAMAMGQTDYLNMLEDLSVTGRAAPGQVEALARLFPGVRYAAFGRIETDQVATSRDRQEHPVYEPRKKDQKVDVLRHYEVVETFSTSREVAVQLTVIELPGGLVVWSGRTRETRSNQDRLQSLYSPRWTRISIEVGEAQDFPPPPGRDEVVAAAFREAAEAMLDPDSQPGR